MINHTCTGNASILQHATGKSSRPPCPLPTPSLKILFWSKMLQMCQQMCQQMAKRFPVFACCASFRSLCICTKLTSYKAMVPNSIVKRGEQWWGHVAHLVACKTSMANVHSAECSWLVGVISSTLVIPFAVEKVEMSCTCCTSALVSQKCHRIPRRPTNEILTSLSNLRFCDKLLWCLHCLQAANDYDCDTQVTSLPSSCIIQ